MPLGTEYRIATKFTVQGKPIDAWVIRNVRCTFDGGADAPAFVLNRWVADMIPFFLDCFPPSVTIDLCQLSLSSNPALPLASLAINLPGELGAGNELPANVCGLIRLLIDAADTRHPAKLFMPFVPVMTVQGQINAYLDRLNILATALLGGFGAAGPGGAFYQQVKWSRSSQTSQILTIKNVSNEYWTQRRRIPRNEDAVPMYPLIPF